MGRLGSERPGAIAANGVRDALESVFLADHALAQAVFHGDQLLGFAFEQAADGNAGPLADQRGDILFVDLFLQHAAVFLHFGEPLLGLLQFALGLGELAVANLGHARQFAGTLVALLFRLQRIDLRFPLADCADGVFFHLPASFAGVGLLAQSGQLLFELLQALARMRVGFLEQRLPLDFQLHDAALDFVDLHGQ